MSFTGIVKRENNFAVVTEVGKRYLSLYSQSPEDAWQWLVTRTLWLYVVPNGTDTGANRYAKEQGISFSFFTLLLGLLAALAALPRDNRFLSYLELCHLFDDDNNWEKSSTELFSTILANRAAGLAHETSSRSLLGDLEDEFEIGRDNLNTILNKAFFQTGLFEYKPSGSSSRGAYAIALSSSLDPVLQRRYRFVIDNPKIFEPENDWNHFLQPMASDLPLEVPVVAVSGILVGGTAIDELSTLESEVLATLLDRKNVILYAPPGTGKSHTLFSIADAWANQNGIDSVIPVTFHPAFGYEDFIQGFRPLEDSPSTFTLQKGALIHAADEAVKIRDQGRSVLMVIDEINRGDVARIFGELITYIEPDKRGRPCRLAQSPKADFAIPENLFFLGSMNSADKSVSLLDVALRRRFAFIEFPADHTIFSRIEKWKEEVGGIKISELLEKLNQCLLMAGVEPDRAIGHALLGIPNNSEDEVACLAEKFRFDIIPLVQEYCYLDRARMQKILGSLVDSTGRAAWNTKEEFLLRLSQFLKITVAGATVGG